VGKRVLITGGSGFIGANLARRALADGHEVHLFLRPGHRPWRVEEIAKEVHTHAVDLTRAEDVRTALAAVRPDWVFHLAAYGAYPIETDVRLMVETNLLGCVSLLDACVAAGVGAFVNAGSSSEYGYKDHAPAEEESLEPNSAYAVTKAAATHYTRLLSRTADINALTVRLWSIYGPYEEPKRLIPTLLVHALEGRLPPLVAPDTARDFVFVDDAVDALLKVAAAASLPRGSVYNLCSGIQSTLRDVVEETRRLTHLAVEPLWGGMKARTWDTSVWVGSPERMTREVGWRAHTTLSEGLARTARWLRSDPERFRHYSERILTNGGAGL
jgi:dolichol-phosphate mannosyltransferase